MKSDLATTLNREADQVGARISKAFGKLARKMRRRADKAKAAMVKSKNRAKSAILQRRFEMYTNAAHEIDQALTERQAGAGSMLRFDGARGGEAPRVSPDEAALHDPGSGSTGRPKGAPSGAAVTGRALP